MAYQVKEIFKTLQGEGANSGRTAVFLRFAGCNGWSGLETDRNKGPLACSAWCDTDFVGTDGENGGRYEAVALASKCAEVWGIGHANRFVVLTGGEPTLQVDPWLVDVLHRWEFEVAIETNGTRPCPNNLDWITVSPKPGLDLFQTKGDELKLVYPQPGVDPVTYEELPFAHHFLQPMDGPNQADNAQKAIAYCYDHPWWKLSVQTHKVLGLA